MQQLKVIWITSATIKIAWANLWYDRPTGSDVITNKYSRPTVQFWLKYLRILRYIIFTVQLYSFVHVYETRCPPLAWQCWFYTVQQDILKGIFGTAQSAPLSLRPSAYSAAFGAENHASVDTKIDNCTNSISQLHKSIYNCKLRVELHAKKALASWPYDYLMWINWAMRTIRFGQRGALNTNCQSINWCRKRDVNRTVPP